MSAWSEVEAALDGMLARRWYTNHGPMAQRLETAVAVLHGVRHAVVAANPTIALIMLMEGLGLAGRVLVSAEAPGRCVQAVRWAGLEPVVCRLDGALAAMPDASALLISERDDEGLAVSWAEKSGLVALRDGPGGRVMPEVVRLGGCGEAAGIGCVLTGDDGLAARLRNIRSSYGAGPSVPVARTVNGRVSEAQAAMALIALGLSCHDAGG